MRQKIEKKRERERERERERGREGERERERERERETADRQTNSKGCTQKETLKNRIQEENM